jgi:hypothetical protein
MVFGRTFEKMFGFIPKLLREGFSTSLAAQIGVAPILYYTFGYINILSPIINALVLWTVSYITILGMIAGVVGICVEPMGKAILFILYPLTSWFILVVEYFG